MESDQSQASADHAILALKQFVLSKQTGQLTFHFTNGTLRQIQRNVFETCK